MSVRWLEAAFMSITHELRAKYLHDSSENPHNVGIMRVLEGYSPSLRERLNLCHRRALLADLSLRLGDRRRDECG